MSIKCNDWIAFWNHTTSGLFSLHVQDVLWHRKPHLKVTGGEGRSLVLVVGCSPKKLFWWVSRSGSYPACHIWWFSSSLFLCHPTCLHVPCLHVPVSSYEQLVFSTQWTHWVHSLSSLIEFTAGNNILQCRPPQLSFELCDLLLVSV